MKPPKFKPGDMMWVQLPDHPFREMLVIEYDKLMTDDLVEMNGLLGCPPHLYVVEDAEGERYAVSEYYSCRIMNHWANWSNKSP